MHHGPIWRVFRNRRTVSAATLAPAVGRARPAKRARKNVAATLVPAVLRQPQPLATTPTLLHPLVALFSGSFYIQNMQVQVKETHALDPQPLVRVLVRRQATHVVGR